MINFLHVHQRQKPSATFCQDWAYCTFHLPGWLGGGDGVRFPSSTGTPASSTGAMVSETPNFVLGTAEVPRADPYLSILACRKPSCSMLVVSEYSSPLNPHTKSEKETLMPQGDWDHRQD